MTIMHAVRAVGFLLGVETEYHLDDLTPVSARLIGIEQSEIGLEMPLIIRREARQIGRTVVKRHNGQGEHPASRY